MSRAVDEENLPSCTSANRTESSHRQSLSDIVDHSTPASDASEASSIDLENLPGIAVTDEAKWLQKTSAKLYDIMCNEKNWEHPLLNQYVSKSFYFDQVKGTRDRDAAIAHGKNRQQNEAPDLRCELNDVSVMYESENVAQVWVTGFYFFLGMKKETIAIMTWERHRGNGWLYKEHKEVWSQAFG